MVKETEVKINLKEAPSDVKDMIVGANEEGFLIGFNRDKNNSPEKAFFIKAEQLSEIIGVLFESGVLYQKETGIDIGFNTKEESNDDE